MLTSPSCFHSQSRQFVLCSSLGVPPFPPLLPTIPGRGIVMRKRRESGERKGRRLNEGEKGGEKERIGEEHVWGRFKEEKEDLYDR